MHDKMSEIFAFTFNSLKESDFRILPFCPPLTNKPVVKEPIYPQANKTDCSGMLYNSSSGLFPLP